MSVESLIEMESAAAEPTREAQILPSTKVSRGHGRTQTLQVRLTEAEYRRIADYAAGKGLPVSTMARDILLAGIETDSNGRNSAVALISRMQADLDMLATQVS